MRPPDEQTTVARGDAAPRPAPAHDARKEPHPAPAQLLGGIGAAANATIVRELLDSAPDAIIVVQAQGQMVYVNKQAERLFGYTAKEMLGRPVELLVPDRFQAAHPGHRAGYTANPHFRAMGGDKELYGRHKDGSEIPVEISLAPIRMPSGMLVASAIRDVSERKLADAAGRLAAERLEEIERLKRERAFKAQVLNVVSHELNTPLTPVKVQMHLMRQALEKGDVVRSQHALDVMKRNVDRFATLVKDILDVSRLEGDRLRLDLQQVDLARVAQEAVESFAVGPGSDAPQVEWTPVPAEAHATVCADPLRVTQVVYNLLANAIRHTRAPGRVSLRVEPSDDEVRVIVADDGPGLSANQIQRLFQPFSQVHDPKADQGGTGLGLYISQGIAEAHDGRLECKSPGPGRGAAFTLILPRRGPTAPADEPGGGKSTRTGRRRERPRLS